MDRLELIREYLEKQEFFHEMKAANRDVLGSYACYCVDHGRKSRSTHKFWWNHFEDACSLLGVPCYRTEKNFSNYPASAAAAGRRKVFLFFTRSSFSPRAARVIRAEDIVAAWDLGLKQHFPENFYWIRFKGNRGETTAPEDTKERIAIWEAFAPARFIGTFFDAARKAPPQYDFGFFGGIHRGNYDQFENILVPLYRKYRCAFGGLSWRRWRIPYLKPLFYGFSSRLVDDETAGFNILSDSRINIAIHHRIHREAETLTERVFTSSLLGKPVICDNKGAAPYYADEVAVETDQERFLARCDEMIAHLERYQDIARSARQRTLRHYTYLNTAINFLRELA